MMSVSDLPTLNAVLNGTCSMFLIAGYIFVRQGKTSVHKACMITALVLSVLFLASYVTYHNLAGFNRFAGTGFVRWVYFSILIPHTILATVAVVPLALLTVFRALRGQFDKHKRIARWTLPIWLYVSVTGVIIYFMLYHL